MTIASVCPVPYRFTWSIAASSVGHDGHRDLEVEVLAAEVVVGGDAHRRARAARAPSSPTSSTSRCDERVGDAGQERVGHRLVHDERLGRVAHARAVGLRVDRDAQRFVEVGVRVDVDVAVAVAVDDHRHGRVVADALDQRGPTAGHQAVDVVGELHHRDRGLVAHVVDEEHGVGRAGRP